MIKNIAIAICLLAVTGCSIDKLIGRQVTTHGYQFNPEILELVPEGSSKEQVMLSLGTPNTTQIQQNGNETFYYMTQKKKREAAFLRPDVIEQTVMVVAFNDEETVESINNYELKDGKVFAFNREVTPSSGKEITLITQLLLASRSVINPLGGP